MIKEIVLPETGFRSTGPQAKEDRVRVVTEHVHLLLEEGFWEPQELPQVLLDIYATDYLLHQVLQGGFDQWFYTTEGVWNEFVLSGLKSLENPDYVTLFEEALSSYERSLTETPVKKYKLIDDRFRELQEEQSLLDLNYNMLESITTSIRLLDEHSYNAYIQSVTTDHTGFKARQARHEQQIMLARPS